MLPLLHRHLSACPGALSPEIHDRLEQSVRRHVRFALAAAGELIELLGHLEREGIPAIPLKGPVLAHSIYGDLTLRQFVDLDILIRPEDALRTNRLLASMGYPSSWGPSRIPDSVIRRSRYSQYRLLQGGAPLSLDLQWELFPPEMRIRFDLEGFFERAVRVPLGGLSIRTLSPEDQLLFLCAHAGKHACDRLLWLVDIAELIRSQPGMKRQRVIDRMEELEVRRMVCLPLLLARDLLGAELPEDVAPFHVAAPESRRDRRRYAVRHFLEMLKPTAREWSAFPLPDRLFFLYYLFRPLRLAGKWLRRGNA